MTSGLEKFFIVRTSWLYGPGGNNFVETIMRLAKERENLRIVADQVGSPTYTGDLAEAIFNLVTSNGHPYGIYHFANEGECSWYDFALEIVGQARNSGERIVTQRIQPISTEDYPLPAKRPAYSVLSTTKYRQATGARVPEWRKSLRTYFENRDIY